MATTSGRRTCAQCGANNFDTVTACWKCGAPLHGGATAARPPGGAPGAPPIAPPQGSYASPGAIRAAVWLGLLLPYIGLPVGLIFLMLDDERRAEVGRACVLWSCISLVLHLMVMAVIGIGTRELLFALLQGVRGAATRGGGMGGFDSP